MKRIIFLLFIVPFSCRPSNNCDVIKIDEKVDSLQHSFTSPIENPFKMESEVRWKFNDTVIINNIYYGPMDTMFTSPASDFYNEKSGINFSYKRYKASKVEIYYSYCFY